MAGDVYRRTVATPQTPRSMLRDFDLGLPWWCDGAVKRALGLRRLEHVYRQVCEPSRSAEAERGCASFCKDAIAQLGHSWTTPPENMVRLGLLKGPVMFVANHPFGGLDALILLDLMNQVRADCMLVSNEIASIIPELASSLISVNILAKHASSAHSDNRVALLQLMRHLNVGGSVGLFPAGEVATRASWRDCGASEKNWHPHVGALVLRAKATVVPVYIEGQNSRVFQLGALVSPRLAMPLLARELLRKRAPVHVSVGLPITPECIMHMSPIALSAHLRETCLALGGTAASREAQTTNTD